jgi:glycerophosphoryl diester phosphodiesterase
MPIVIGHRGASGYVPEHTLAAYFIAIEQGADYIEPDLVITKDGILVARHENAIAILNEDGTIKEATTDIAERSEFADRKTTKVIDGVSITGWFTEDFTLAELKTLRCKERLPQLRTDNTRFDSMFEVPSLDEILNFVDTTNKIRAKDAKERGYPTPKPIGIYPETKYPTYFRSIGLSLEEPLVEALYNHGYASRRAPVFIQSFEVGNLKALRKMTKLPLVQLLNADGKPYDFVIRGDSRIYSDLATPQGLEEIATYADGIGVNKNLMIPRNSDGRLGTSTTLVSDAHAKGLIVHGWTFRAENNFLPTEFRSSVDPSKLGELGDMAGEVNKFLEVGMDGFFTDHPNIGVIARNAFVTEK